MATDLSGFTRAPNTNDVHRDVRATIIDWLPRHPAFDHIQSRVMHVDSNGQYDTFEYETPSGSGNKKTFLVTVSVVEI